MEDPLRNFPRVQGWAGAGAKSAPDKVIFCNISLYPGTSGK